MAVWMLDVRGLTGKPKAGVNNTRGKNVTCSFETV
jgi:hypothetical protein